MKDVFSTGVVCGCNLTLWVKPRSGEVKRRVSYGNVTLMKHGGDETIGEQN